jgi:hypothetical protein
MQVCTLCAALLLRHHCPSALAITGRPTQPKIIMQFHPCPLLVHQSHGEREGEETRGLWTLGPPSVLLWSPAGRYVEEERTPFYL